MLLLERGIHLVVDLALCLSVVLFYHFCVRILLDELRYFLLTLNGFYKFLFPGDAGMSTHKVIYYQAILLITHIYCPGIRPQIKIVVRRKSIDDLKAALRSLAPFYIVFHPRLATGDGVFCA